VEMELWNKIGKPKSRYEKKIQNINNIFHKMIFGKQIQKYIMKKGFQNKNLKYIMRKLF